MSFGLTKSFADLKFTHYFHSFALLYCALTNSFIVIITSYRCSTKRYSIGLQGSYFIKTSLARHLFVIGTAYAVT